MEKNVQKSILRNKPLDNKVVVKKLATSITNKADPILIETTTTTAPILLSNRLNFQVKLHSTIYLSYIELSFNIQGLAKPTQAVVIILNHLVDKLQSYN